MTDLERKMEHLGIDVERSREILNRLNKGAYDDIEPVAATGIPEIDGDRILDRRKPISRELDDGEYRTRLSAIAPEIPPDRFGSVRAGTRYLTDEDLKTIGVLLYPYVAYGVLNGGSATSYADQRKNRGFNPQLFALYQNDFDRLADSMAGLPKGITPAFLQPDGTRGPSFLELKFRHLLLGRQQYRDTARRFSITPPATGRLLQVFEMTSAGTEPHLRAAYETYRSSPLLAGEEDLVETLHRVQPLLAAFSHSSAGRPKTYFSEAGGVAGTPLGLPGGHGQNFQVLAPIYRQLHDQGKRFVYLGNVDNIGFTLDPAGIALLALSGAQAGFDFSFRTPVDVKGGVLLYDQKKRLNCADIGPAISRDDVLKAESEGKRILFNCATGLFNLSYLVNHLGEIVETLPVRISDQDKDAGQYSQAEQVTWEIIGMLDDFLVYGIDKYQRFLAAKMMVEMLITSGLHLTEAAAYQKTAPLLHNGLVELLSSTFDMIETDGRWVPVDQPRVP